VRGEVLVAIINNRLDFTIAHESRWYRVPVGSKEKWLRDCWPPKWLALYQTKAFGQEAYAINYYAKVIAPGAILMTTRTATQSQTFARLRRPFPLVLSLSKCERSHHPLHEEPSP
jgi:hypothetical protein